MELLNVYLTEFVMSLVLQTADSLFLRLTYFPEPYILWLYLKSRGIAASSKMPLSSGIILVDNLIVSTMCNRLK